jgi:Tfp pilus assembly protein PilE
MKQKNNERGITLIALIITVIVMAIIAGVAVSSGSEVIKEARVQDIKTNMLLIQAKAKIKLEEKKFDSTVELIGSQTMPSDLKNESGEDLTDYYCLSSSDLEEMNLGNLNIASGQYYLVKYDIDTLDVDVFYTAGVSDENGNVYYKLSQMQD